MKVPDRVFYPLSALSVLALIIVSALYWPNKSTAHDPFAAGPETPLVITGDDLGLLVAGPGLSVEKISRDGEIFARSAAGKTPFEGLRSAGVFITLPPEFSRFYAGKTIALTMTLRAADENPAPMALIAYFAVGRKNSPYQSCPLKSQWTPCTLIFTTSALKEGKNVDYVGLWPDMEGLSRFTDLRAIRLEEYKKAPPLSE